MSCKFGWWYNWLLALQRIESSVLPDVVAFGSPCRSHMSECFSDGVFLWMYGRWFCLMSCGILLYRGRMSVMLHLFDQLDILSASLDASLNYSLYIARQRFDQHLVVVLFHSICFDVGFHPI